MISPLAAWVARGGGKFTNLPSGAPQDINRTNCRMLARRAFSVLLSRAGHVCMRSSCKSCMGRLVSSLVVRSMASKAAAVRADSNLCIP